MSTNYFELADHDQIYLFEWDEQKANTNYKKHQVSFEAAAYVFLDENRLDYPDEEHSLEEDRFITIGQADNILFVVYCERGENYRIISARFANQKEEAIYFDDLQNMAPFNR